MSRDPSDTPMAGTPRAALSGEITTDAMNFHPKRADTDHSIDDLYAELAVVTDRHKGPLTDAEIAQALYDFADSYAEVTDVGVSVSVGTDPADRQVALVEFPEDDLLPAPIGKWRYEDRDSIQFDTVTLDDTAASTGTDD